MKQILVISNLYPSKEDPSYGTFVKLFVDSLKTFYPNNQIEISVIKGRSKKSLWKLVKYINFYFATFFKLLFNDFDLIYVHYISHSIPPIWLAAKMKKLNLAFNIHGDDLIVRSKQGEIFLEMARPLLCNSRLVVVPSTFFKDELKYRIPEIEEENILVSPSGGIDNLFFFLDNINSRERNDVIHLGYVSRIDYGKGWDVLIDAVKELVEKDITVDLSIIGTGAEVQKMQEMIRQYNLQGSISYLGAKSHKELPEIYKSFDLFIFPSELKESLGLVGLEAMAACTPVIGSNIGGIKSYVEDGVNGFLFEPGSAQDLVRKIVSFKNMELDSVVKMRENAYKTAIQYESSRVSELLNRRIAEIFGI